LVVGSQDKNQQKFDGKTKIGPGQYTKSYLTLVAPSFTLTHTVYALWVQDKQRKLIPAQIQHGYSYIMCLLSEHF